MTANATPMNPPNEWNVMEITLDGNRVQVAILAHEAGLLS